MSENSIAIVSACTKVVVFGVGTVNEIGLHVQNASITKGHIFKPYRQSVTVHFGPHFHRKSGQCMECLAIL